MMNQSSLLKRRSFLRRTAGAAIASSFLARGVLSEQRNYRACVIGHTGEGDYGHRLHRVFSHRPDVEVVGLSDPEPDAREAHAREARAKRTYADYREMLSREKPDLVVVAPRWTTRHKEYVLAAAEVGAHGLIEKPLARDLAEADEMIRATRSKGLKWTIAFQKRLHPDIQAVKRKVFEGDLIGDVLELRGRGKEDERAGGEDLVVLGTHVFDLMTFFTGGRPQWCESFIGVDGREATPSDIHDASEGLGPVVGNQIHAKFMFAGGMPAYFNSLDNPDGNGGRFGLEVYGTKGIVKIRLTGVPEVFWLPSTSWFPGDRTGHWQRMPEVTEQQRDLTVDEMNARLADLLIESIEKGHSPQIDLEDGLRSLEMIQSVWATHIQGGRVSLPLDQRAHPLRSWS